MKNFTNPGKWPPLFGVWLALFSLLGTSARAQFGAWQLKYQVGTVTTTYSGGSNLNIAQTYNAGLFPNTANVTMPYLEVWTFQNTTSGTTGALVTNATVFNYRVYPVGSDPTAATSYTATMVMNSSSGQDRRSQFLPNPALNLITLVGRTTGSYVFEYWINGQWDETIGTTTTRKTWRVPTNTALSHRITFTVGTPAPAPTFSPAPGVYDNSVTVTMSTTLTNSTIRYTTNGTTPTASSPAYTDPLTLTNSTTLVAGVFAADFITTSFTTGIYTVLTPTTVRPPEITPNGGNVAVYQAVSASSATTDATLRYTTNGTEPTASSPIMPASLTITATTTLRVKGFKAGWIDSPTTSATFTRRDPGLWGAKFRPNGINVEWYYNNANQANADMTKAFTGATVVANGTPMRFGAEGHGSSDMPEAGFNDGKLNYRVYRGGDTPPTTFSIANMTLSNPNLLTGNRQLILDFASSGLTLQGMVSNQPGSYTLDAFYTYEIYDRQNGNGPMVPPSKLTARYPAAGLFHRMTFDVRPAAPTFALSTAEVYEDPVSVTITPGVAGAAIYYTLDGSTPTASSTPYTGPFTITTTRTVRAVYLASGMPLSDVGTAVYTINPFDPNLYPRFVTSGNKILKKTSASDPGTPFVMKGTNFNGTNWNWDFANDATDANMVTRVVDLWGFNTLRINCFINSHQSYKRRWNSTDDQKLKTLIDRYTARGVVCMIEVHDNTGWYPSASTAPSDPAAGPCTQAELNAWWAKKAREYRNNNLVWFNIQNEPGSMGGGTNYTGDGQRSRFRDMHQQAIAAIRSTQAENVIVVDAVNFASEGVGYATVIDDEKHRSPAIDPNMSSVMQDGAAIQRYDPKNNVVFAVHPYTGWDTPGKFKNYMDMVSGANFPVIVGETGGVFRQTGSWRVGWGARALWDIMKYYRNGGHNNSPGWLIWHWNGSGEQKFSYGGGCDNINTYNGTKPTNLNREGSWVWDQLKNPNNLANFISVPASGTTRIQVEQAMQWMGNYEQSRNASFAELSTDQVRAANGAEDRYTGGTGAKEWTEWDINVAQAGIYKLTMYGFNKGGVDANFQFRSYNGTLLGQVTIPANTNTPAMFNSNAITLPAGEQIFRIVRLEAVDANYSYFDIAQGAADVTPPTAPTNVREFTRTSTTTTIRWDASTDNEGVGSYEVFRNGTSLGKTGRTYLTDTGLQPNTAYTYTVKAFDFSNNASDLSSGLTLSTDPVQPVTNIDDKTEGTDFDQVSFSAKDPDAAGLNGWVRNNDAANFGGTETYTARINATITIKFNGIQALIYGTKKAGHGDMRVAIDGGPEYDIPASFYTPGADARKQFIFATPKLTNGPHTIVLRNLGQYVAFDYLEVSAPDVTPPVARAKNATLQLNAQGQASITANEIDDNSTDDRGVTGKSLSKTSFDCQNLGANTVVLTVTDAAGNSSTATATVTVEDKIAPTAVAKNITLQLNAQGQATLTAAQVDNGSSDNCGPVTLSLSKTSFDCQNVGQNQVTLTVTDGNGNTATATATVTVGPAALAPNYASVGVANVYPSGQTNVTVAQYSGSVTFSANNCAGTLSWSGPNGQTGTGNIVVPTNATGTLNYTGQCTLNTCVGPTTTVTVTVNAGALQMLPLQYNCATRQLTVLTTGGNGNALEYQINSVTTGWEPIAQVSTLEAKHIGRELKVRARQRNPNGGYTEVEVTFTPTACSSGRVAAVEVPLSVKLLGNPIGERAELEVLGAAGSPLTLTLTDLQGRQVGGQQIGKAGAVERISLPVGQSSGMLLLRVSTPTQAQTVKLLKE